jgi:hypothetical protein
MSATTTKQRQRQSRNRLDDNATTHDPWSAADAFVARARLNGADHATEVTASTGTEIATISSPRLTRQERAIRINLAWRKRVESIFEVGDYLEEDAKELDPREYKTMVNEDLIMDASTARRLRRAAKNRVLRAHVHALPACWGSIYELSKLPDGALLAAIEDGTIHPKAGRAVAEDLVEANRRRSSTRRAPEPVPAHADGSAVPPEEEERRADEEEDEEIGAHEGEENEEADQEGEQATTAADLYDLVNLADDLDAIFNGSGNGKPTLRRRIESLLDRNADPELRADVLGSLERHAATTSELINLLRSVAGESDVEEAA